MTSNNRASMGHQGNMDEPNDVSILHSPVALRLERYCHYLSAPLELAATGTGNGNIIPRSWGIERTPERYSGTMEVTHSLHEQTRRPWGARPEARFALWRAAAISG